MLLSSTEGKKKKIQSVNLCKAQPELYWGDWLISCCLKWSVLVSSSDSSQAKQTRESIALFHLQVTLRGFPGSEFIVILLWQNQNPWQTYLHESPVHTGGQDGPFCQSGGSFHLCRVITSGIDWLTAWPIIRANVQHLFYYLYHYRCPVYDTIWLVTLRKNVKHVWLQLFRCKDLPLFWLNETQLHLSVHQNCLLLFHVVPSLTADCEQTSLGPSSSTITCRDKSEYEVSWTWAEFWITPPTSTGHFFTLFHLQNISFIMLSCLFRYKYSKSFDKLYVWFGLLTAKKKWRMIFSLAI